MLLHTAAAFAQRGYAVVMPLRRGFGATGGEFAEDPGTCSDAAYSRGERAAAEDVLAAYEFTRKLPYVDASRIILAGQSAGGVAALYAAAQAPEGLVAVLSFAAGRGAIRPGRACPAPANVWPRCSRKSAARCARRRCSIHGERFALRPAGLARMVRPPQVGRRQRRVRATAALRRERPLRVYRSRRRCAVAPRSRALFRAPGHPFALPEPAGTRA